jgi:hypothetical protein
MAALASTARLVHAGGDRKNPDLGLIAAPQDPE